MDSEKSRTEFAPARAFRACRFMICDGAASATFAGLGRARERSHAVQRPQDASHFRALQHCRSRPRRCCQQTRHEAKRGSDGTYSGVWARLRQITKTAAVAQMQLETGYSA